ncbi:hypothetical protein F2Q70_00026431 [Brassica cretica]|uniref:Uncharacterized protein n=1 Tax=Brassica cretica TaxID=69181 RepID=A0A8S9LAV8_BRACR|nr:hypothetical protein F2Q70_00026431 [Brassica cretica]
MNKEKEVSAEIRLQKVVANIDLLNELKDEGLTVDAELARLKEMEKHYEGLVTLAAVPDWSISELDLPQVSEDLVDQAGGSSVPDIADSNVSEALTEFLCEETRLPRASPQEGKDLEGEKSAARIKSSSPPGSEGRDRPPKKAKTNGVDHRLGVSGDTVIAKPFHWQFSHSKDCPFMEDPDSVAHLVRHFKPAGCPHPSLQNMTKHEAYVKMAVAHAKAMGDNNKFAAALERRLQDVPRSDELYEIKKVVRELKLGLKMAQEREGANAAQLAAAEKLGNQAASLEVRLRVVSNERKSTLEQVSFLEAKVESSANKFSDDLHRATYDAKKALADSYLDVLVSLKEKWEKKKVATDCEARLREVMANIDILKEIMNNNLLASDELMCLRTKEFELEVMAVSDFSVEKLDLPQIAEDLPEDFFAKVPSAVGDEMKRAGGQFEDATKREGKRDARKIEALTDDWRRACQESATLAAQVVAQKAKIAALEEKWMNKKNEVSAEIHLQEVVANIDLLDELKDGGLTMDAELARLKEMEKDCEGLVTLAAVSDWSISELDLPQVSEDSVDQARGSSVPDGADSN